MNWFAQNAAAIQAVASIAGAIITAVLVGVTWRYVRLTGTIAASSVNQLQEMKATIRASNLRNVQVLSDLASRVRNSLGRLDADIPRENQLRPFTDVNESDVARLELFASQVDHVPIVAAEAAAVVAIREILGIIADARSVHPDAGWRISNERIARWRRAREESDRSLHEIENECQIILRR